MRTSVTRRRSGWCAGLLFLAMLQTAIAEPRRVLLLHSFGPHFQPWSAIAGRFREDLVTQSPYGIDLYEASLQSARLGHSPSDERPFLEYLRALFGQGGLDLIVTLGAPATRFFQEHRSELFPSTPLLIMGTDARYVSDPALTTSDIAVSVNIEEAKQIDAILQLFPDTTNIAVIIGDSALEKLWVRELRRSFERFTNRVTFDWWNDLSLEEMVKRAATLPPRSAIYYASVRVDAHGVPHEDDRALLRIHDVANAPIFSYIDISFGRGIVGGPLLSSEQVARESASVAKRILSGETPANMKSLTLGLAQPVFDWRELQRWNVNEALLPPDANIQFRTPPPWEQYRMQIIAVFSALIAQAAVLAWLIYERRRRHHAEVRAQDTMSDLLHLNRMATAGELSASIAHEVNQPLAGIVANADAGIRWLTGAAPNIGRAETAFKQIVAAGHHASDVITSVRALYRRGREERVNVQFNELIRKAITLERIPIQRCQVSLQLELSERLPEVLGDRVQLLQVILNLIRNAVEAMSEDGPRILRIRSHVDDTGSVLVSIEDSGKGMDKRVLTQVFDPLFTTKQEGLGIGLSICKTIVEGHNGRLWVTSAVGEGTTFYVMLPRCEVGDGRNSAASKQAAGSASNSA